MLKLNVGKFPLEVQTEVRRIIDAINGVDANVKDLGDQAFGVAQPSAGAGRTVAASLDAAKLWGPYSRDLLPTVDDALVIGSPTRRWKKLEVVDINIPAGHTYDVGGSPHTHSIPSTFPLHVLIGAGTTAASGSTRQSIITVSEDFSDLADADYAGGTPGLQRALYMVPSLDRDLAGFDFNSGEYNILVTTGFDSTDQAGSGLNTSNVRGHRVYFTGVVGGAPIGTLNRIAGFEVKSDADFGSMVLTELVGFATDGSFATTPAAARSYGVKVGAGNGTLAWGGMFAGDVQLSGSNKLRLGSTTNAKATDTMFRQAAGNIRWEIAGTAKLDLTASGLAPNANGGLSLGLNNLGWSALVLKDTAAAFELTIQASNIGADRTLTIDPSGNFTLTIDGNATLNDWFDQSVKAAASPSFAGLTVNTFAITVNGAPTLNNWFDQSVKTTAAPTFGGLTASGGGAAVFQGIFRLSTRTDLASGTSVAIPSTGNYFRITGTTDIDTLTGGTSGQVVVFQAGTSNVTIRDKSNSSSNIINPGSANKTLTGGNDDLAVYIYDGTNWICWLFAAN